MDLRRKCVVVGTWFSLLLLALMLSGPAPAWADKEAMPVFHEELTKFGQWADHEKYGPVWSPKKVQENWRPYFDGRWTQTTKGWVFETDEPWGSITYHFGNWAPTEELGWVWVPGSTWYPNTANWRKGKEHIGWAPIPPPNYEPPPGLAEDLDEARPAKSDLDKKTRPLYVFSKSSDFVRAPGKRYTPEANYSRSGALAPPEDLADLISDTEELDNLVAMESSPKAVYNFGPTPNMLPGMGMRGRGRNGGMSGPGDLDELNDMGGPGGMGGPGDLDELVGRGGMGGGLGDLGMQLLSNVLPTKDLLNRNPSMGGLMPGGDLDGGGYLGGVGSLQSTGTSGLGVGSGGAVDATGGGSSAAGTGQGGGWRDWMGISSPLMILERQYAAGMITKQEYEAKKNELTGQSATGTSGTATGGTTTGSKDTGATTGGAQATGTGTETTAGTKAGGGKSGASSQLSADQLANMSKKDLRLELEKQLGHKLDGKYDHMSKEQLIKALAEAEKGPAVKTAKDDGKLPGGKGKDPKPGETVAKDGKSGGKPGSGKGGGLIKVSNPGAKPGLPDVKPPPKEKPVVVASIPKVPKTTGQQSPAAAEEIRKKIRGLPPEAKYTSTTKSGSLPAAAGSAGVGRGAPAPGQLEMMSKKDLRQALEKQQGGKLDVKTTNLSREEMIKTLHQGGQPSKPAAGGVNPQTGREGSRQAQIENQPKKNVEIKQPLNEGGRAEAHKRDEAQRREDAKKQQEALKQQEQVKKQDTVKAQQEEKRLREQQRRAENEKRQQAKLEESKRKADAKQQQDTLRKQEQARKQEALKARQDEQKKQQAQQRQQQEQQRRTQQAQQQEQQRQRAQQQQAQRQAQIDQQRQAQMQQQQLRQQQAQQQAQQQMLQQQQIRQQQAQQQQMQQQEQARQQEEARRRQAQLEQQQMQQQQQQQRRGR